MNRLTCIPTPLRGLTLIQRHPIGDQRGYLERLYCVNALADVLDGRSIAQINHTLTSSKARCGACTFSFSPMPRPSSSPA